MTTHVVLADDITGAGDSGIHFAVAGRRTALVLQRSALNRICHEHEVVSVSSESRFLSPEAAARAVRAAARDCRRAGAEVVFKKIDSTFRGNPGAEIAALLDAGGFAAALICPAMPKTGRTVLGGRLLVDGAPIDQTDAGRDPFHPVRAADIAGLLAGQTDLPPGRLDLTAVREGPVAVARAVQERLRHGDRLLVADAVEDRDLAVLGQVLRQGIDGARLLPVGAGGLAEAFAGPACPAAGVGLRGRMLAVVGSLTAVSRRQADHAVHHGGFLPLELDMDRALVDPDGEIRRLLAGVDGDGRPLLLRNRRPPAGTIEATDGERAAGIFARATLAVCEAAACSVLYATGGSTAMAIMTAMELPCLTLERECLPGVVVSSLSRSGPGPRWFISKAGGFGGPDTIVRLAEEFLQPAAE
ncbi:MAG: four-carbon acid sugar kinase family protein [Planctomycetes bacterium]|nr:four-carbon acid sugar kinase family protein [Planctomycetota bacterium]